MFCAFILTLGILSVSIAEEVYINQFAVHIEGGDHAAKKVANELGFVNLGKIGSLDDHYLFEATGRAKRSATTSEEHHTLLGGHSQVQWFEQQLAKSRRKRDFHSRDVTEQMSVIDPFWSKQWYLHGGAKGGYDMNVLDAWRQGYTGKNIVVTILDDGLERDHPDLLKNYDPYASYDVNNHDYDPMPRYDPSNENRHGTRCAGEVAAEANNTACTIGVAPDAKIGGIRMLDGQVYDAVEAASLSFNRSHIDIYSASWGPDDDGKVVDGPGNLAKKAFITGIALGRGGKGSIFVWASGNGGSARDSCNCDGYANSIFTLSISSTSEHGLKPWYLEECSSTLATTYSSGAYNEKQIASTDLHKRCTVSHTGTSASAPLAAGIVALILEANKDLTWRDVQYITLMTARPEPMFDGQWITNGVGRKVSLRYGYGLMDASAMVNLALIWTSVPEKYECLILSDIKNERLESHQKYSFEIHTSGCEGTDTEVNFLEHVQARISLTYERRGAVTMYLTSPKGTRSQILPARPVDSKPGGFDDWPFLSVHFWGENPRGTWKLEIEDANSYNEPSAGGNLLTWSLVFHGTKIQPVRLRNATSRLTPVPTTIPKTTPSTEAPKTPQPVVCHNECVDGCTGKRPQDCVQCKHFRIGHSGTCVSTCPVSYYVVDGICEPCDISCFTCNGPTLTQCLSCHPGVQYVQMHDNQNICNSECLPGFHQSTNSCLPCSANCKECTNADSCLTCDKDFILEENMCNSKAPSVFVYENMSLAIISICVITLLVVLLTISVIVLRQNQYLCWSTHKFYGRVPKDEEDACARLTYNDDIDDSYGP